MFPLSRSISMWDVHDPGEIQEPRTASTTADERTQDENEMLEIRLDLIATAQVLDAEMEPGTPVKPPERGCCNDMCAIL